MPIRTIDTEHKVPLDPRVASNVIARIAKEFTFDAAHFLPTVPVTHKCNGIHGHTYRVELQFRDYVDSNGFCGGIDYADIAGVWMREVFEELDHQLLNDVPGLEIPTTEVLAVWIFNRIRSEIAVLDVVRVSESSTTWCEVRATEGAILR